MKNSWIISPFLIAIYPVFFLYVQNSQHVAFSEVYLPSAILLTLTTMFFMIGIIISKNTGKISLLLSLFWVLFFTYGRLDRPFRIMLLLTFFGGVGFIIRSKGELKYANLFMTVLSTSLMLFSVVTIAYSNIWRSWLHLPKTAHLERQETIALAPQNGIRPDIYYMIPDGYGRGDILADNYNFDNSEFIDFLRHKGFYVAKNSRSNYCQTLLSLTSSLNIRYLEDDFLNFYSANDREPLRIMLRNSRVMSIFHDLGYLVEAFPTGYSSTDIRNADIYLEPRIYLNEFQNALLDTTLAIALINRLKLSVLYDIHKNIILNIFERLCERPLVEEPIFVFAHILAPHPPFVFGELLKDTEKRGKVALDDGSHYMTLNEETPSDYRTKYIYQLKHINSKIEEVITRILADKSRQSIIIIQADHGPGSMLNWEDPEKTNFDERLSILNAYYFPNQDYKGLYDDITPVNSFRLIFDQYFGGNFGLIHDKSYFSTWSKPYDFIEIDPCTHARSPQPQE